MYILFAVLYVLGLIALVLVVRDIPLRTKWKDLSIKQWVSLLAMLLLPIGLTGLMIGN